MSQDVSHFRLPDQATPVDRATLRAWKLWVTWLRPILLTVALMSAVSAVVGTTIARSGGTHNAFVAVWSPADHAASASLHNAGTAQPDASEGAWGRGIFAQLLSVIAAATAALLILRRVSRPIGVGTVAGSLVVFLHLTLSHQWGLQPIAAAPLPFQAGALATLWVLPVAAAAMGAWVKQRRAS